MRAVARFAPSVTAVVMIVGGTVGPAAAAAGDLDPGFGGGDGQVTSKFDSGSATVQALAVQSDGKIVAGGSVDLSNANQAWVLVRYKPGGQLDPTFGEGGRVVTDFTAGNDVLEGLAILGNGKIVAGGHTTTMFAAVRYTNDGHLDHSFGGDGKVLVNFGSNFDGAYDMAKAPGGKVVLAGEKDTGGGGGASFALARLTSAGALDHTFDGDGKVVTPFPGFSAYGDDLIVHDDGSILMSGELDSANPPEVGLAAYRPNGSLDPAFGDHGQKAVDVPMFPRGLVQLRSGKIVLAGSIVTGGPYDAALLRLKPGGDTDQSFGPGGLVTQDFGASDYVEDLHRSGSGLVMAVALDVVNHPDDRMAVVRLVANGAPDPAFGDQGVARSTLQGGFAQAIAVQKDGRVLLGGSASGTTDDAMAVARFLAP